MNFMVQCSLVFELWPSSYDTDKIKVLFIIFYLFNPTFQWARSIIFDPYHPFRSNYSEFRSSLEAVYFNYTY